MTIDLSQAKPGDVFLTRGGVEARFMGEVKERGDSYLFYHMDSDCTQFHFSNGLLFKDGQSSMDIIAKKPEKRVLERWINVLHNGLCTYYESEERAKHPENIKGVIACLHIRREYTEGEGLS
ncbi:MAG: hypothetical protein BGO49_28540 [Planctomycetales bacterium 71-10]|nr:MAG: hypothetical protein BGO49_28540 [Planctomycetales bacterium 71-10]